MLSKGVDGGCPFAFLKGSLHFGSILASVIFPCKGFVPCEIKQVDASSTGSDIQEVPINKCLLVSNLNLF